MNDRASATERQIFGKLGSVSLNDIIQLLGMSKRTATLELRRGHERGRVYFRNGQVVHATAGRYEGEESFIELLGWGDADFAVEEGIGSLPKISITKSTEALLLSTMTALDEVGRVTGRPPVGVAPSITLKRLPPRPRARRAHSSPKRVWLIVGGAIAIVSGAVAALSMSPVTWSSSPWRELPPVDTFDTGSSSGAARPGLVAPDAWAIASAVWERPSAPEVSSPTLPRAAAPATDFVAAEPAYLTVVVEPWARVDIDGAPVGETPLGRLELSAGTHRVTLSNDHVVGVIRDEVVIVPGESLTKRYSFDDTGYLSVVVSPWADVSVDGRLVGQTPLRRLAVPAGLHTLRFVHPELGETERTVSVTSSQTTLVKVELP